MNIVLYNFKFIKKVNIVFHYVSRIIDAIYNIKEKIKIILKQNLIIIVID